MNEWNYSPKVPTQNGEYEVKNNFPECNNGQGFVYYDVDKGWDIQEPFVNFYKIIAWRLKP